MANMKIIVTWASISQRVHNLFERSDLSSKTRNSLTMVDFRRDYLNIKLYVDNIIWYAVYSFHIKNK